jgi:hypothetical protein
MKLFQQLMLAPAALGLVAPLAAQANGYDMASSTTAINTYTQQHDLDRFRAWEAQNQVTSVNQFADVKPTDWAYQALSNLVERYGCVAGYPNGTYKGGQAMTRFEAAALLNACLDRVTETTDELQRLLNDFQKELAVIRGRVDGLEKKVGNLEATQFSTTTKLRGETSFILGGVNNARTTAGANNATTFNYDARISFDTSFTGKDFLRTRLRSGNFSSAPFGSSGSAFKLDKAETPGVSGTGVSANGVVIIDRLYYTFPVGNEIKLTVGPLLRNTEVISFLPSAYKADILDFFNLAGATGTYNKATGAGAAFQWKQNVKKGKPFATFDVSFISQTSSGAGAPLPAADSNVGVFGQGGAQNILAQFGVKGQSWGAAVAYRYGAQGALLRAPNTGSVPVVNGQNQNSNSVSLAAYWEPIKAGWIPSISAGFSYTGINNAVATGIPGQNEGNGQVWSWMTGFQWNDVFQKGNSAGFALGMPQYVQQYSGMMYELFYKYKVSDNITITPSLFWLSNSFNGTMAGNSSFGGVIQTTFRF